MTQMRRENGHSRPACSLQLIKQYLCFFEVARIQALTKPAVYWREKVNGFSAGTPVDGVEQGLLKRAIPRAWPPDSSRS
jgi:hypothetical protein